MKSHVSRTVCIDGYIEGIASASIHYVSYMCVIFPISLHQMILFCSEIDNYLTLFPSLMNKM